MPSPTSTCRAPNCRRPVQIKKHQLCESHYWDLILAPRRPRCSAPACNEPQRAKGYCSKHYYRLRRSGHLGLRTLPDRYVASTGYIRVRVPDGHPLRDQAGLAFEHRLVVYNHIGYGPHRCHWCHLPLTWRAKGRHRLDVDHLDGNKANNNPANLVPSCHQCNVRRATAKNWAPPALVDMSTPELC